MKRFIRFVAGFVWTTWEVLNVWEKVAYSAIAVSGSGGAIGLVAAFSKWELWLQILASVGVALAWMIVLNLFWGLFKARTGRPQGSGPIVTGPGAAADSGAQAMSGSPGGTQIGGNVTIVMPAVENRRDDSAELRRRGARVADAAQKLITAVNHLSQKNVATGHHYVHVNEIHKKDLAEQRYKTARDSFREEIAGHPSQAIRERLRKWAEQLDQSVWSATGTSSSAPTEIWQADRWIDQLAGIVSGSEEGTGGLAVAENRSSRQERGGHQSDSEGPKLTKLGTSGTAQSPIPGLVIQIHDAYCAIDTDTDARILRLNLEFASQGSATVGGIGATLGTAFLPEKDAKTIQVAGRQSELLYFQLPNSLTPGRYPLIVHAWIDQQEYISAQAYFVALPVHNWPRFSLSSERVFGG